MIAVLLLQYLKITFILIHLMNNIDMWEGLKQRVEEPPSPPQWTYT